MEEKVVNVKINKVNARAVEGWFIVEDREKNKIKAVRARIEVIKKRIKVQIVGGRKGVRKTPIAAFAVEQGLIKGEVRVTKSGRVTVRAETISEEIERLLQRFARLVDGEVRESKVLRRAIQRRKSREREERRKRERMLSAAKLCAKLADF